MRTHRHTRRLGSILVVLALAAQGCSVGEPLHDAKLSAINDRGQVAGIAFGPAGYAAFVWDSGTVTWLGTLGGEESSAHDINGRGQVVGSAETKDGYSDAFLYDGGVIYNLNVPGGSGNAEQINERGQIMGTYRTSAYGRTRYRAFFWDGGVLTDLGLLNESAGAIWPCDMNNRGQIVGSGRTYDDDGVAPFMWEAGRLTLLAETSGEARDINDRGQIVGWATNDSGDMRATLWEGGRTTDLGTLGGRESEALAVNERGQVAGWAETASGERHAAFWEGGRITDTQIASAEDVQIYGLSEQGQVLVGTWKVGGPRHVYLWGRGGVTDLGVGVDVSTFNASGQFVGEDDAGLFLWDQGARMPIRTAEQRRPAVTIRVLPTTQPIAEPTPAPTITPSP